MLSFVVPRGLRFLTCAVSFIVLLAGPALPAALQFPALTDRVVDEAGVLAPTTRADLINILARDEQTTGRQVVVVTVKSLQGDTIEDYGYRLGRQWGIGQKGSNTGALLIVAPNDRQVRIEVGYGLEGQLTDATSSAIINQTILPAFRRGDIEGGTLAGTVAILRAVGDTAAAVPTAEAQYSGSDEVNAGPDWGTLVYYLILIAFFGWRFLWPLLILGSPRVGWGGGGFPGAGSSGGGFRGGGGSFGGGGASGRW